MDSILLMFLTVIVGGCLFAIAIWSRDLAKAKGREFHWWHWLLIAIWAFSWLVAFAWLGTSLGEGDVDKAGWIGFGIILVFNVIIGLITWQLIARQKPSEV